MRPLHHVGFFHLDATHTDDPVDLLKDALRNSAQASLFGEALVVLPEAFNILGDYYQAAPVPEPDPEIQKGLIALSGKLGLCFIVGLIDDASRHSEAVLIDEAVRDVLSRKTLRDGSSCYKVFTQPQDKIVLHRGVRIGALICMDATEGYNEVRDKQRTRHGDLLTKFRQYAETAILCVPARFGTSGPVEVAKAWNKENLSIVIGNWGTFTNPSTLHLDNGKTCAAPPDGQCHVHLEEID